MEARLHPMTTMLGATSASKRDEMLNKQTNTKLAQLVVVEQVEFAA
jgi:hypothetical protein